MRSQVARSQAVNASGDSSVLPPSAVQLAQLGLLTRSGGGVASNVAGTAVQSCPHTPLSTNQGREKPGSSRGARGPGSFPPCHDFESCMDDRVHFDGSSIVPCPVSSTVPGGLAVAAFASAAALSADPGSHLDKHVSRAALVHRPRIDRLPACLPFRDHVR